MEQVTAAFLRYISRWSSPNNSFSSGGGSGGSGGSSGSGASGAGGAGVLNGASNIQLRNMAHVEGDEILVTAAAAAATTETAGATNMSAEVGAAIMALACKSVAVMTSAATTIAYRHSDSVVCDTSSCRGPPKEEEEAARNRDTLPPSPSPPFSPPPTPLRSSAYSVATDLVPTTLPASNFGTQTLAPVPTANARVLPALPDEVWLIVFSQVSPDVLARELMPLASVCRRWCNLLNDPRIMRCLCFHGCVLHSSHPGCRSLLSRAAAAKNAEALFALGALACLTTNATPHQHRRRIRSGHMPPNLTAAIALEHPNAVYFAALLANHRYTGVVGDADTRAVRKLNYLANKVAAARLMKTARKLGHLEANLARSMTLAQRKTFAALFNSTRTSSSLEAISWTNCMVNRYLRELPCSDSSGVVLHRCTRPLCGFREGLMDIQLRQRCARCSGSYYCSAACQLMDWPRHMQECVPPEEAAAAAVGGATGAAA